MLYIIAPSLVSGEGPLRVNQLDDVRAAEELVQDHALVLA